MAGGRDPFAGRYTYSGSRPYTAPLPTFTQIAPAPTPVPPIVTGIEPEAYNAILYGKDRPLFVGGDAPIGGRPCEGVFWSGTQDDPRVSFIAYHAEAAAPGATREIRGARLRGKEVTYDGSGLLTSPQFAGSGARVEFRTGTTGQAPCSQSVLRYGAGAIGYSNGILSSWTNVPVRLFGGIVPMPTVRVWQGDDITLTDALAILLRYARYADADFEVDVRRSYSAVIVPGKTGLIEFLQRLRALLVRMNINYHDTMRIIEPEGFDVAIEVTHSNTIADSIKLTRLDPLTIPREKIAGFINQDRDHEFDHVRAREDLYPVATTASVESESFELALVTTGEQMLADIHVSLFEEAAAKSQLTATLMADQFGAEPGDGVRYADDPDVLLLGFASEVDQSFEDFTAGIKVLESLNCGVSLSPCEVPEDGVTYIDFLCPRYWVDGTDYEQADVIGGTGTAEIVEDEGLLVDGENGSFPRGIGAFLAKWAEMLTADGLTVVVEFKPFAAAGELLTVGTLFMTRNTGDTRNFYAERDGDDLQVSAEAIGGFGNWNIASGNQYVADAVNAVAITFLPDPDDEDGGKLAISLNGAAAATAPSGTKFTSVDILELGHQYEFTSRVSRYLRRITVYPPVDDADLPGLSTL